MYTTANLQDCAVGCKFGRGLQEKARSWEQCVLHCPCSWCTLHFFMLLRFQSFAGQYFWKEIHPPSIFSGQSQVKRFVCNVGHRPPNQKFSLRSFDWIHFADETSAILLLCEYSSKRHNSLVRQPHKLRVCFYSSMKINILASDSNWECMTSSLVESPLYKDSSVDNRTGFLNICRIGVCVRCCWWVGLCELPHAVELRKSIRNGLKAFFLGLRRQLTTAFSKTDLCTDTYSLENEQQFLQTSQLRARLTYLPIHFISKR